MLSKTLKHLPKLLCALCFTSVSLNAATITSTLGDAPGTTGFTDGQILTIVDLIPLSPSIGTGTDGSDPIENFDRQWTHNYGALADTILSATWEFGIYDHDSASLGSQLGSFVFEGTDMTGDVDTLFEGAGGANAEYNVYSMSIGAGMFADLLDGIANLSMMLSGSVESPPLLGGPPVIEPFNGAKLIFSTLTIETQAVGVPSPSPLILLLAGLWALRRNQPNVN